MKKVLCLVALMVLALSSMAPVFADGWLYTDSTVPGKTELQTRESAKVGYAQCYNVLNLVEWGDCSLNAAMSHGRIKQVHHYDFNNQGWIFFKKITTEVYGD